jgi:2-polyprenyl-3-methyl-5-hydroxy-6-metoxy-1,4-benzoquinol methylase
MNTVHYDKCPFCSSENIAKVFEVEDFLVSHKKFEIWHCNNCGLRFTQYVPSLDDIGSYYKSEEYISHSDTKQGLLNKLYHIARNYMLSRKYSYIKNTAAKSGGKLLDIGAGTGYFANYMLNKGYEVEGIEVDSEARKVAKKNFGIELQGIEKVYSLPENNYDVITMWHVLEHIHDLDGYMMQIYNALRQDGVFVCAVPNFTSFDAEHYKNNWAAYDVPRHLWHFSPEFFYQFAAKYNFEVFTAKPMPLDAVYISLLSEKIKKGSAIAGFMKGGIFFTKSLFNKNKASSIIYFLSKR